MFQENRNKNTHVSTLSFTADSSLFLATGLATLWPSDDDVEDEVLFLVKNDLQSKNHKNPIIMFTRTYEQTLTWWIFVTFCEFLNLFELFSDLAPRLKSNWMDFGGKLPLHWIDVNVLPNYEMLEGLTPQTWNVVKIRGWTHRYEAILEVNGLRILFVWFSGFCYVMKK